VLVEFLTRVRLAERGPEIAQAPAKGATDLGKSLRTENQQGNHQHEDEMRGLKDVSNHQTKLTGRFPTLGHISSADVNARSAAV
jgi:hypothetical protein